MFLLFLAGCDLYGKLGLDDTNIPGSLPDRLLGEWVFPASGMAAERYLIKKTGANEYTIQYGYGGGASPFDFKGIIRFVSNYNDSTGVIIIEYTEQPSYPLYNGNSFLGIYYQKLRENTVQLANAINLGNYGSPDTAALDEAIEKFTRFKMRNFVDWGVVQPQTRVRP